MTFFNILFHHDILQGIFQDKQSPPSDSLKLLEFETYYIKPNPPLFLHQQNMQWCCNLIHSHFTLCLRACDYIKQLSQHPWYSFWMRVKNPHHCKVTALGSCVEWPLNTAVKLNVYTLHAAKWPCQMSVETK